MPIADLRGDHGGVDNLRALSAAGVSFAAHQFGGTPEDLACLENLPIRVVHLASSLTRRRPEPGSVANRAITELITLIHRTGATVTVDDLTTSSQANWWHQAGADTATGPPFARGRD